VWSGSAEESIAYSSRALDVLEPLFRDTVPSDSLLHDFGRIRSELGWWLIYEGRISEGMAHVDSALEVLQPVALRSGNDQLLQLQLWRSQSYRLDGFEFTDRSADARDLLTGSALPHLHAMEQRWPLSSRIQYALHVAYDYPGNFEQTLGQADAAVAAFERSIAYARNMVERDGSNLKAHEAQARSLMSLGYAYAQQDVVEEALDAYRRAVEIRTDLFAQNPENGELGSMLASSYRFTCRLLPALTRSDGTVRIVFEGIQELPVLQPLLAGRIE